MATVLGTCLSSLAELARIRSPNNGVTNGGVLAPRHTGLVATAGFANNPW